MRAGDSRQLAATIGRRELAATCRESRCFCARTYYSARADTYSPVEGNRIKPGMAADATERPALYRGTYWGNSPLDANGGRITAGIIRNRNAFARRWKLRAPLGWAGPYPERGRGEDFDHPELYRDAAGWLVLVASNYGGRPPGVLGMERIAPIYAVGVASYAGRFASMRELKARIAACDAARPRWRL